MNATSDTGGARRHWLLTIFAGRGVEARATSPWREERCQ
jgi:hypothetical protein